MSRNILIILVMLISILSACNSKTSNQVNPDELLTISVNPDNTVQKEIYEIFNQVDLIPIETNKSALIQGISQVVITDDRIYIHDGWQKSIFWFSRSGKFIGNQNYQGKGPSELTSVYDIKYDQRTNCLYLLGDKKIKVFDRDMGFMKSIHLPELVYELGVISDTKFVLMSRFNPNSLLFTYDVNSEIIEPLIHRPEDFTSFGGIILSGIYQSGQSQFFTAFFTDTIWVIKNDKIAPLYRIDFGKYTASPETWIDPARMLPYDFSLQLDKSGKAFGIRDYFESNDNIVFSFSKSNQRYTAIINKLKNQTDLVTLFGSPSESSLDFSFVYGNNQGIYMAVNIIELKTHCQGWESHTLPDNWKTVIPLVLNLPDDGNPILLCLNN